MRGLSHIQLAGNYIFAEQKKMLNLESLLEHVDPLSTQESDDLNSYCGPFELQYEFNVIGGELWLQLHLSGRGSMRR